MSFLKRLFSRERAPQLNPETLSKSQPSIEDTRSNPNMKGEVILNLWYVSDRIIISSLRAKTYIASGSDDEKLGFLKMRAKEDFENAQVFPVPESMKANLIIDGVEEGKACTHDTLEVMGGQSALFREIVLGVPKRDFDFDPTQALLCITGLLEGDNGVLSVSPAEYKN